jgi:hypothetical protein
MNRMRIDRGQLVKITRVIIIDGCPQAIPQIAHTAWR